ncbi:hypothetical protein F66182_3730 [Fusarium sp. NRRL 66182]|nr:hypothetical protein F66182_3730 [Fusarium sp. NRRL 66182]
MARTIKLIEPAGRKEPGPACGENLQPPRWKLVLNALQHQQRITPTEFTSYDQTLENFAGRDYKKAFHLSEKHSRVFLLTLHSRKEKHHNTPDSQAHHHISLYKQSLVGLARYPIFFFISYCRALFHLLFAMAPTIMFAQEHEKHSGGKPTQALFTNQFSEALVTIPAYHATRADLDKSIDKVVLGLASVRQEMIAMATKDLINEDQLTTVLDKARSLILSTTFVVNRFYHDKEEGLRTSREREYAALGESNCTSRIKRALITARHNLEVKVALMERSKNSRINKLDEALEKIEKDTLLSLVNDGWPVYH